MTERKRNLIEAILKEYVNLHVTPELKQEIIKRELDQLGYSI